MLQGIHLQKRIGSKTIVRSVSLSVKPGEIVGLLGPNGAGKTSTFLLMAGLLQPDHGKILLDGQNVTRWPLYRKSRLGLRYLPQEPSIFQGLNVEDNIRLVLELTDLSLAQRHHQLETLLDEFHLTKLRAQPSSVLSGGEKRRLEIARALAGSPSFILLDEPLAGIDPRSIDDLQILIQKLAQRSIGILITDHNVREVFQIAHRAYIIFDGEVLEEGTPYELSQSKIVRSLYLGDTFQL